ncbi:unnamed protein product [Leptosia nina]|uniref:Retinol dehydrogenase 14 n=1 Tax=Leptosia nina TaxID=320188 RepID=A0AAV1J3F0_9NEOP
MAKVDIDNLRMRDVESHYTRYANSKLCNVLWTKALAKRLHAAGVTVNCVHPGLVKTNIFQRLGNVSRAIWLMLIGLFFKSPVEGAQTCIHLCVAPELENATGDYYSECKKQCLSNRADDDEFAEAVWRETLKIISD